MSDESRPLYAAAKRKKLNLILVANPNWASLTLEREGMLRGNVSWMTAFSAVEEERL